MEAQQPLVYQSRRAQDEIHVVERNGGNAYGTSPNPANNGKYEDSYAFLGGMGFPTDQYASGTVYKSGTTGGYLERSSFNCESAIAPTAREAMSAFCTKGARTSASLAGGEPR
jgi:hypothetical protein